MAGENTSNYRGQDGIWVVGSRIDVASGGTIKVLSGGSIQMMTGSTFLPNGGSVAAKITFASAAGCSGANIAKLNSIVTALVGMRAMASA